MLAKSVFTLQKKIDHTNQAELEENLLKFIGGSNNQDILVDFQSVEFVDGSGLRGLVNAYQQAKNKNKNVYLFNVSPAVRMILEISQLDQIFAIEF
jgi:anti-anti-sigma factor